VDGNRGRLEADHFLVGRRARRRLRDGLDGRSTVARCQSHPANQRRPQSAASDATKGRYSPAECTGIRKTRIEGNPDPKHVSTSYAERHNLNMRMQMRRFTRLTTGYSKKIENHCHMVALYTVWYNWIRTHKAHRVTPAMAAGLTDKLMDMADVARLIDDAEVRATIQQRAALFALPQSN
jgi:hypothetical protein